MKDKTCIITGATAGIGLETAAQLGSLGARLVLVGRNREKGESALARLRERVPGVKAEMHYAGFRRGIGTNFASFLRFWAVAARMNSSRAPFGPLSRNRSSLSMRLRCANSISTFLRSRLAVRPSHGRPVFDMFVGRGVSPIGVTITGGDAVVNDGPVWRVAKLILISRVQALLHSGQLKIHKALPDAPAPSFKSFALR